MVTFSFTPNQRLGNQVHNCTMNRPIEDCSKVVQVICGGGTNERIDEWKLRKVEQIIDETQSGEIELNPLIEFDRVRSLIVRLCSINNRTIVFDY